MALTDLDMQLLKSIADMHKINVGEYNFSYVLMLV